MTYCVAILNVNAYILNQIWSFEIQYLTSKAKLNSVQTLQSYKTAQTISDDTFTVFIELVIVIQ